MNIFVAKLPYQTTDSELRAIFEAYGEVSSAKIIVDKFDGRSKGFGFVEMPDDEEGKNAIKELDNTEVDGRVIVVKKAQPKKPYRNDGNNRRSNRNYY